MWSEDVARMRERIATMQQDIARILTPVGTVLRCPVCGASRVLTPDDAARYIARGWPRCCGRTMRMIRTEVQDGE